MKDIYRQILKALRDLQQNSLTNTKPYIVDNTSEHEVVAYAIQGLVDDTQFTTLEGEFNGVLSNKVLNKGEVWYVKTSKVQLSQGSCILYRKNP